MSRDNLANGFIDGSLNSVATTVALKTGYGALMPAVDFYATITPFGELSTKANSEIVKVTAVSGDNLTIVRGQRSTSAKSFTDGAVFSNGIYVEDLNSIVDIVYPIGAIYMSVNSTNPGTLFGGSWAAWGTGRVPVAVDTGQTEFNTVEKTGGHKLLQAHTHTISPSADSGSVGAPYTGISKGVAAGGNVTIGTTGGGDSQNLQPYITCYMWKRTA